MAETFELWGGYRLPPQFLAKIDSLRSALEEAEVDAIVQRRMPLTAIEAMKDADLFRLALPRQAGGLELDLVSEMEAYERLARISVTAAWNVLVGNIHTAWAAAYVSDEAFAEMFPPNHRTVMAGQAAPVGQGRSVAGGFLVSGRYSWGSGISHADWVLGGFRLPEDEAVRVFVAPKTQVTILDNWHVLGVEGSGSYDYVVENLFVPDGYWFDLLNVAPRRGGPRFRAPVHAQASVPHTAVALGGAEHALELIAGLAQRKRRSMHPNLLAERGAFQRDLGQAYVAVSAARDHAARMFASLEDRYAADQPLAPGEISAFTATAAHANQLATDVATMAFRYGGGDSVRIASPIQRVLRDLLVAQSHVAAADTSYDALGRAIIDQAMPPSPG